MYHTKIKCIVLQYNYTKPLGAVLIPRGSVVEAGQRFEAAGVSLVVSEAALSDASIFEPVPEGLSVSSRPDEPGPQEARDWVIEVRVSTTTQRLRDVEDFLRRELPRLL